ncbi:hypothetical protein [Aeromicrobium stalagmiti]|uniref:hypothetical protein n=1 Tax=Aeromicrobium stalagmiti TaxID=2738988 RepID=UPI001568D35B|nr:hypothetical protein [Aeromicrobium stalagmiti]NRQ49821.1 hypothetical protein [Aeromicrobium stalagmiti]
MTRDDLQRRQQSVLRDLLAGDVPPGFDPRSAAMTIGVLRTKRRSEAIGAVPALRDVPDLARRFDTWAAENPRRGCSHDDVLDFLVADAGPLPEPLASVRAVERVYRRHTSYALDRRPGHRRWVVALGSRVRHVGPQTRPATSRPSAPGT